MAKSNYDKSVSTVDARLGRVERDLSAVNADLASVRSDVRNVAERLEGMAHALSRIESLRQTNWGTLGTLGGLLVSVMVVIGALSLDPIRGDVASLKNNFRDHEKQMSHPGARVELEALKDEVEETSKESSDGVARLDETLQREMRLLDLAQQTKLDALDKALQREIGLRLESRDRELSNAKQQLQRLSERLDALQGQGNRASHEWPGGAATKGM